MTDSARAYPRADAFQRRLSSTDGGALGAQAGHGAFPAHRTAQHRDDARVPDALQQIRGRPMTHDKFTVGLIQEAVSDDIASNVERATARVREAAKRGAQIICLQELFNAPYFCKTQQCDRFDIAEPI